VYVVNENFNPKIAKATNNLFGLRDDANYTFEVNFSKEEAFELLDDTKIFIKKCKKFL
jgi:uncharacterized protein (UPF0332 family)